MAFNIEPTDLSKATFSAEEFSKEYGEIPAKTNLISALCKKTLEGNGVGATTVGYTVGCAEGNADGNALGSAVG